MRNSFFCCLLLLATGASAATTVHEAPYGKAELVDTVEATNVVTEISFMTPEIVNIRRMRELTGQVPMIPAWGYGYFQSKERYASADENMGVAAAETTATPGPVYNLQGIQMPEGTNLPAGIYIQDNKKFIIK